MGNKVHNKIVMGEHWDMENIQQYESKKGGITYMLIKMEALDEHGVRNTNIKTQWWIVCTKNEAPLCIGYDEDNMKFIFSCVCIGVNIADAVGNVGDIIHKKEVIYKLMKMKAKAEGIDIDKMQAMIRECKAKGWDMAKIKEYVDAHMDELRCAKDSSELDAYTKDLNDKLIANGFNLDAMESKMNELLDSCMSPEDVEKYMHEHMMDFKKPAASGRSDW